MKIFCAVLVFYLTTMHILHAQDWQLVYQHDEKGHRVEGSVENLKTAIKQGAEIRLAWWFQDPLQEKRRVYHLANAAFITIQSDSIVYAQIRPIVGQIPDFEIGTMTLKENLEWVFIGGTNGKMDTMTRNVITGEVISHELKNSSFKWFVKH